MWGLCPYAGASLLHPVFVFVNGATAVLGVRKHSSVQMSLASVLVKFCILGTLENMLSFRSNGNDLN